MANLYPNLAHEMLGNNLAVAAAPPPPPPPPPPIPPYNLDPLSPPFEEGRQISLCTYFTLTLHIKFNMQFFRHNLPIAIQFYLATKFV